MKTKQTRKREIMTHRVAPELKDKMEDIAHKRRISLNRLANQVFQEFVAQLENAKTVESN
jgi:predicted HicB family RNase H-like nuclease